MCDSIYFICLQRNNKSYRIVLQLHLFQKSCEPTPFRFSLTFSEQHTAAVPGHQYVSLPTTAYSISFISPNALVLIVTVNITVLFLGVDGPLMGLKNLLYCDLTFLNMTSDMTASEVKRAAMGIIMMPTGMLLFRPVRAEIHPLRARNQNERVKIALSSTNTALLL